VKPPLHLFDLDRTFVRKNLSYSFYFYLLREGIVSPATLAPTVSLRFRYLLGQIGLIEIHRESFRFLLKGMKLSELEEAADRFVGPFIKKWINLSMQREFEGAKKRGERVYLLSSSADFLVKRVAHLCGFDQFGATEYLVDNEGRLCDISSLVTGPEKLVIAKRWAGDVYEAIAYSDSGDDVPLLEWSSRAVAVYPDRRLLRVAKERGWPIVR
jgi:phosphoserine phosphatase